MSSSLPAARPSPTLDNGVGPGLRDVMLDFHHGQDLIDLSGYRSVFSDAGGRASRLPVFLGTDPFTASFALQIRYESWRMAIRWCRSPRRSAAQPADLPGDGAGDGPTAEIELAGIHHLSAADFLELGMHRAPA